MEKLLNLAADAGDFGVGRSFLAKLGSDSAWTKNY